MSEHSLAKRDVLLSVLAFLWICLGCEVDGRLLYLILRMERLSSLRLLTTVEHALEEFPSLLRLKVAGLVSRERHEVIRPEGNK